MAAVPERTGNRPPGGAAARSALDLIGLSTRAGASVSGTAAVRAAVREGHVRLVVLARDGADGQLGKLIPLLEARRIPFYRAFLREELGAACGRAPVSAVGLTNPDLAARAGQLLAAIPPSEDQHGR